MEITAHCRIKEKLIFAWNWYSPEKNNGILGKNWPDLFFTDIITKILQSLSSLVKRDVGWEKLAKSAASCRENLNFGKRQGKKTQQGKTSGIRWSQRENVVEQQQKDLIQLQTALEAEAIAHLRADREWNAQKKLDQNLKNQLNKLVHCQRALELQINTAGEGVENELEFFSPEEKRWTSLNMMSQSSALVSLMQQSQTLPAS